MFTTVALRFVLAYTFSSLGLLSHFYSGPKYFPEEAEQTSLCFEFTYLFCSHLHQGFLLLKQNRNMWDRTLYCGAGAFLIGMKITSVRSLMEL